MKGEVKMQKRISEEKIDRVKWEVIEDSGGGLYLAVFDGDKCIYFTAGLEHYPENLKINLQALDNGENPTYWDSYPIVDKTPQERYDDLTSWEYGWTIVATDAAIFPERMGASATKAFGF